MDQNLIKQQLPFTVRETHFNEFGERYQGKVRDTYARGNELVIVTTDRISAFDHVLPQTIPFKGQVLNTLAAHFFTATHELVPNHVISVPHPAVTLAARCETVPIEFVVRGYLVGHAWRVYRDGGRTLCGNPLPEGLRQNERLPAPILTPTTKATAGHDEDISAREILDNGLVDKKTFDLLSDYAFKLFEAGTRMAAKRGLILVDTKYEFGKTASGRHVLIDEVHTPDSSRYFYSDTYESLLARDKPQRQLSKEFVREWLMENGFMGREGEALPDLPDEFRIAVGSRYVELYETVTGSAFEPDISQDPVDTIRRAIERAVELAS